MKYDGNRSASLSKLRPERSKSGIWTPKRPFFANISTICNPILKTKTRA